MQSFKKSKCVDHSLEQFMPIISINERGVLVLTLPSFLKAEQKELEQMLNRVFTGKISSSPDNLALAQQLSLNWCVSKAKKTGITDKCICQ